MDYFFQSHASNICEGFPLTVGGLGKYPLSVWRTAAR